MRCVAPACSDRLLPSASTQTVGTSPETNNSSPADANPLSFIALITAHCVFQSIASLAGHPPLGRTSTVARRTPTATPGSSAKSATASQHSQMPATTTQSAYCCWAHSSSSAALWLCASGQVDHTFALRPTQPSNVAKADAQFCICLQVQGLRHGGRLLRVSQCACA